tara:strand:- start:1165 stop:1611 length:447 start_codon:yes stop_codon:yes gene_type:complete
MATLTPTLTLASTDAFANHPISLSVTDTLTIAAPMSDISTMNTDDDLGYGAGVIIDEEDTNEYYVYIKHTGLLASDGTTASHATNDFISVGNGDGDAAANIIKLQPGEFCFFPTTPADGTDGGVEVGGVKATAGSAAVRLEYAYFKRG